MTDLRVPVDFHDKYESHRLYRCYDADGRLVYIGCTVDVKARMGVHQYDRSSVASALLQRFMARHEVDADVYRGRIAGQTAERAAISAEQPLFNQQHTGVPAWIRNGEIARYIDSKVGALPPVRRDRDGYETGYVITAASLREMFEQVTA